MTIQKNKKNEQRSTYIARFNKFKTIIGLPERFTTSLMMIIFWRQTLTAIHKEVLYINNYKKKKDNVKTQIITKTFFKRQT